MGNGGPGVHVNVNASHTVTVENGKKNAEESGSEQLEI